MSAPDRAVIFRIRADREAIVTIRRSIEDGGRLDAPLGLDRVLAGGTSIRGYQSGALPADRDRVARGAIDWTFPGDRVDAGLDAGVNVLTVPEESVRSVITALRLDPRLTFAYEAPDRKYKEALGDPYFDEQWAIKKCGFPAAWGALEPDDATPMSVAIVDTGYTPKHPDLPNPVYYETFGSDAVDRRGHGTLIAGVLAAKRNNGYGLAGGAICDPWIFKVYHDIFDFDLYHRALRLVGTSADIKVMNLSLGDQQPDEVEKAAIAHCIAHGVTVVAAIGNKPADSGPIYPALYDDVIAVGSTNQEDAPSSFTIASDRVDVAAPGEHLISTSTGSTGYGWVDGTSFSAALVSAACVLALRKRPDAAPHDVRAMLTAAVAPGTSGGGRGAGRIDVARLAAGA